VTHAGRDGRSASTRHNRSVAVAALVIVVGTVATLVYSRRHGGDYHGGDGYFAWTLVVSPVTGAVVVWRRHPVLRRLAAVRRAMAGAAAGIGLSLVTAYVTASSTGCRAEGNPEECGEGDLVIAFLGVGLALLALVVAGVLALVARLRSGRHAR
jgi:hypothetical protein